MSSVDQRGGGAERLYELVGKIRSPVARLRVRVTRVRLHHGRPKLTQSLDVDPRDGRVLQRHLVLLAVRYSGSSHLPGYR